MSKKTISKIKFFWLDFALFFKNLIKDFFPEAIIGFLIENLEKYFSRSLFIIKFEELDWSWSLNRLQYHRLHWIVLTLSKGLRNVNCKASKPKRQFSQASYLFSARFAYFRLGSSSFLTRFELIFGKVRTCSRLSSSSIPA